MPRASRSDLRRRAPASRTASWSTEQVPTASNAEHGRDFANLVHVSPRPNDGGAGSISAATAEAEHPRHQGINWSAFNGHPSIPLPDLKMTIQRLIILNAAALAASISSSYAGPCSLEMAHMRAHIGAELAAGSSLPQSIDAMMHRQPTRASVAAAEERLAERTVQMRAAVAYGMRRTRGGPCR